MDAITTGVVSNGIWAGLSSGVRRLLRWQIKISSPCTWQMLEGPEPLGKGFTYAVHGTLGHLAKGHEIWLLLQDEVTGMVSPQGFAAVRYDRSNKTWTGRVNGSGRTSARIYAVVAPPTSQDYFRYFQKLGGLRDYRYEPLPRVPSECTNFDCVQARFPKL